MGCTGEHIAYWSFGRGRRGSLVSDVEVLVTKKLLEKNVGREV